MQGSLAVLTWDEFSGMALYRKFIVGMIAVYALGMTVLAVLFAANGRLGAAGFTIAVALVGWVAALSVVPARLGAIDRS
jgi:hypothetical protein